jgi:hypothetical protein
MGRQQGLNWLLRGVFVALIVLTVGWKLAVKPAPEANVTSKAALNRVFDGRLSGPITSGHWGGPGSQDLIFWLPVKGCSTPVVVATSLPTVNSARALTQFEKAGDDHLFAYLDRTFAWPDQQTLLRRRIWNKAAQALGLNSYKRTGTMLFAVESQGCAVARTLPWSRFWTA